MPNILLTARTIPLAVRNSPLTVRTIPFAVRTIPLAVGAIPLAVGAVPLVVRATTLVLQTHLLDVQLPFPPVRSKLTAIPSVFPPVQFRLSIVQNGLRLPQFDYDLRIRIQTAALAELPDDVRGVLGNHIDDVTRGIGDARGSEIQLNVPDVLLVVG